MGEGGLVGGRVIGVMGKTPCKHVQGGGGGGG